MSIKQKLVRGIATSAILLNALAPMAFADTITISGNGVDSENKVEVSASQETTVVQDNKAFVTNNVESTVSSGGNEAKENTGGDVKIDTGDATADINVGTNVNTNFASTTCDNCAGDLNVKISGNGVDSENEVEIEGGSTTEVYQDNFACINNNVDSFASTGFNEAEENTGGDVEISTGDASSSVTVENMANANFASVGAEDNDSSISLMISGNGVDSENEIELEDAERSILIVQENDAFVKNYVDSFAKSGFNEAEENTGGDVTIDTGDAKSDVAVSTMANFNIASAECCDLDLTATIEGNGVDSENEIELKDFGSVFELFQGGKDAGNFMSVMNDVDSFAKTGYNEVEENTGPVVGDPRIYTGDSSSVTDVSTSGNANVFGLFDEIDFPDMDFEFHFDLNGLMGFFHLFV